MGKKLGLGSAVSTVVGLIVATSCLVSLGSGFGMAGTAFILPLSIAFILNIFVAFSFSELNSIMPNVTGGLSQYTLAAFGNGVSIISTLAAYVVCTMLAASVEAGMFGLVLSTLFGGSATLYSLLLMALLLTINILGVKSYAFLQNLTVILLIGSMATMAVLSFFTLTSMPTIAHVETPSVTGLGNVVGLAAIGFWLFIGVEFILPISGDLKNPKRDVPLSMILGLVVLFILQVFLGVGMTKYVSLSALAGDMPHMVFAESLVGPWGKYWMGGVTILAGVSSLNTIVSSCSYILCGMGQTGMVPKVFAKTNKKNSPFVALLTLSVILIGILLTGISTTKDIQVLILSASCFWLLSYIVSHLDVLVLRRKYPNRERSFKLKLFGIPQIVGSLGSIYMVWNIYPEDGTGTRQKIFTIFGIFLAVLVVYAIAWVKLVMKKPFFAAEDIDLIIEKDRALNENHLTEDELAGKEVAIPGAAAVLE